MNKNKPATSLYVHIPFCTHLCHYCDFPKLIYQKTWVFPYLQALKKEIDSSTIGQLSTLYIGGGTPTSLDLEQLETLLIMLAPYQNGVKEYTVEANVENIDLAKLTLLKKYGVNRLSIGVQSFNDVTLQAIGRHHSRTDALTTIDLALTEGFTNLNVDLIYGLPTQTLADVKRDVATIISLKIPHVSLYSLTVNPMSKFGVDGVEEVDQDTSADMYEAILNALRAAGYERYEVSNFALPGYRSQHNQVYWRNQHYYGVGLGASGYIAHTRYTNTRNYKKYISGDWRLDVETLSQDDEEKYYLLTNLRLADGIDRADYTKRFNTNFLEKYQDSIAKLTKYHLLTYDENRLRATDEGLLKLNYVLLTLLG